MNDETAGLQCPEGYDYIALRVFLRVKDRSGIPEHLRKHLSECPACTEKWEFLRRTDATVQRQFQEQISGLIMEVQAREILLPTRVATTHREAVPELVAQIAQALAAKPLGASMPSRLWQPKTLEVGETIQICDMVRSTPSDRLRQQKADATAWFFNLRIQAHPDVPAFLEQLQKWPSPVVDLSGRTRLGVKPEVATEVFASIRDVSYCQNPVLLGYEGATPVFRNQELLELQSQ